VHHQSNDSAPVNATPSPSPQLLTQAGRPKRNYRRPARVQDVIPEAPAATSLIPKAVRRVILHVRDSFRTGLSQFGILREYLHRPSYDPDAFLKPADLANFCTEPSATLNGNEEPPPPWPFDNMSKYLLMNWYHSGSSQKSEQEVTRLAKDVICAPGFNPADLVDFNTHRENKQLDNSRASASAGGAPFSSDDWQETSVKIEVPVPTKNSPSQTFHVPGLHYRPIINIIKETWGAATSKQFHLTPFRRIHVHPVTGAETRIYDEVYTSEAFEVAHDKLQKQPSEPGCKLEKVIAGLMFWSDSTTLANFGTASVWPIYMYYANLSKYIRAKPSSGACHHLAYIPSVSSAVTFPYVNHIDYIG
jgi:hypothetical protein